MATDKKPERAEISDPDERSTRRDLLLALGKWSKVVVGGVVAGGILSRSAKAAWVNRRGGVVVRRRTTAAGPGGTWANRRGLGAWVNRR